MDMTEACLEEFWLLKPKVDYVLPVWPEFATIVGWTLSLLVKSG
jgi:hypothetical protein